MAKNLDMEQPGLGDLTSVMHDQGVSDLSWLDLDVDEYRRLEALPKQNLDSIPELQAALSWDGKDDKVPSVVPMRPHAVVNHNPLDSTPPPLRSAASVRNRLASYIMAGFPDRVIAARLSSEFSPQQLAAASEDANRLISERGVLGNVYVDASFFPRCAQEGPHRQFVAKHAPRALYVLAKQDCAKCVHNRDGSCGSFKKRIVSEVPYDAKLAAHYAPELGLQRRLTADDVDALTGPRVSSSDVKERLRQAFLRPVAARNPDGVQKIRQQAQGGKPQVTQQDVDSFWVRRMASLEAEAMPGPMYLVAAKRLMQGHADPGSLAASSDHEVRSLAREHGILGHTYLDGDALGGVGEVAKFIRSSSARPDFILIRNAGSILEQDLSRLAFPVLSKRPPLSMEHFERACLRAVDDGRLDLATARHVISSAGKLPPGQIPSLISQMNLYAPKQEARVADVSPAVTVSVHHGSTSGEPGPAPVSPEEVRTSIARMMNDGLSGPRLRRAVLSRYSSSDLARVPAEEGRALSANDGIQGSYFIDPTVYPDYGRGCSVGSTRLRLKQVPHVVAGDSCTGCRLQTHPSWCSKYAKSLIRQVPESVREEASERRRLASVPDQAPPVSDPVREYELASELPVDLGSPRKAGPEITMSGGSVTE